MKFNLPINDFTAGEWSPKMVGRTGVDSYQRASQKMLNFIPLVQGGAFLRPGTVLQALPTVTYNSETINPQAILNSAADVRCFGFRLTDGSLNFLFMHTGTPDGTDPWFVITNPYAYGATRVRSIEATTNSNFATNFDKLDIRQYGDTIVIVDGMGPPRVIFKRQDGTHRFDMKLFYDHAYATAPWMSLPFTDPAALGAKGEITVIYSGTLAVGQTVTLTGTNLPYNFFNNSMLAANNFGKGQLFRFTKAGVTGVVEIATVGPNSPGFDSVATATIRAALTGIGTSPQAFGLASGSAWDQAIWGAGQGWPVTQCGYQGRLYFGGTSSKPDTIWGSRIGNIFDFMEIPFAQDPAFTTIADNNARPWTATPNTEQVAEIVAMSSSKMLAILTTNAEITANGSNGALGPNDVNLESSTYYGAEKVHPCRVGNFLTFVQKGGKVRDLIYSFDEYQYKSNDLAMAADHLGKPTKMVSAEFSSSMMFVKNDRQKLRTVTLDRDYNVTAWAQHEFGMGTEDDSTQLLDVAVMDKTEVYFVVRRTFNGDPYVTFEKLDPFYFGPSNVEEEFDNIRPPYNYMDVMSAYSRAANAEIPSDTFTFNSEVYGGRTVDVFVLVYDDPQGWLYIGKKLVENDGTLTSPEYETYQSMAIGFGYEGHIISMPIEAGGQYGGTQGSPKRAHVLNMRLYNTLGCQYGTELDIYSVPLRADTVPLDAASPLVSMDVAMQMPGGYNNRYPIHLKSEGPHPTNILLVTVEGQTHE